MLLILSTFLSYMTSNKNSIDSLNEMLLLCTSLITEIHTLILRFHQCKIIKCTCHYFMFPVLIGRVEFLFFFQRLSFSHPEFNYHRQAIVIHSIYKYSKQKWILEILFSPFSCLYEDIIHQYRITQSFQCSWYYSCIIFLYIMFYIIPFYGWLSFDRLADVLDKNEIIIVWRIYYTS